MISEQIAMCRMETSSNQWAILEVSNNLAEWLIDRVPCPMCRFAQKDDRRDSGLGYVELYPSAVG